MEGKGQENEAIDRKMELKGLENRLKGTEKWNEKDRKMEGQKQENSGKGTGKWKENGVKRT